MSVNKYNAETGELERIAGGLLFADSPVGTIQAYGGSVIPSGYLLCNGQAVSRTAYSELFAVIGTSFGTGDGGTTFNVPDLREATTKGVGLSGLSSDHYDSDGVALGEFIEDRLQTHTHSTVAGTGEGNRGGSYSSVPVGISRSTGNNSGRTGNTTEVKAVGVNYIIKAKHTGTPTNVSDMVDAAVDTTLGQNLVDLRTLMSVTGISSTTHTVSGTGTVSGYAYKMGNRYWAQGQLILSNTTGCQIAPHSAVQLRIGISGLSIPNPMISVFLEGAVHISSVYTSDLADMYFMNHDNSLSFTWDTSRKLRVRFCGFVTTA